MALILGVWQQAVPEHFADNMQGTQAALACCTHPRK